MASAVPSIAHADAASCKDSRDRALVARDGGKVIEARKLLQACSSASCSTALRKECAAALPAVEGRIASVILSAEEKGTDLVDVSVSMDGRPGPRKLDGRAHDVEPGEHVFVFKLPDGRTAERRVVFRDGEKGKTVPVTFGAPPAVAVTALTAATLPPPPAVDDAALRAEQPKWKTSSPLRIVGFSAGGVGLAGIAVGIIFGVKASGKLASECDPSVKACDPGAIGEAKSAATVSTIGFVAGSVLLAGGLALVLVAPKRDTFGARLSAAPTVGQNNGGLSLQGAW